MSDPVWYDKYEFWTRNTSVQFWLHLVLQEVAREPAVESWLTEASVKWREIAYDRRPVYQLGFDEILDAEQKRETMVRLFRRGLEHLQAGPSLRTKDELNALHLSGIRWSHDIPISQFTPAGTAFIHLLERQVDVPAPVGKVKDWKNQWEKVYARLERHPVK